MRPFDYEHLNFIKALNTFAVRYLIIGGHAAIYYGVNRNTGDLDVLIEATVENGHKLIKALQHLQLELPEIEDDEWRSNLVLSFGLEPDAIDILNYSPGLNFSEIYQNAKEINQEGVVIPIIDIRDLLRNKEALNRSGEKSYLDKYDIEVLKRIIEKSK